MEKEMYTKSDGEIEVETKSERKTKREMEIAMDIGGG